jgi:phosphate transport system substrate-binding protein
MSPRRAVLIVAAACLASVVGCKREPIAVGGDAAAQPGAAQGAAQGGGGGRDTIRIVGSSTVYPFATAVAERLGRSGHKTPVIESTGTGGGFKLFCAGVGVSHPDITNASRAIKASEVEECRAHGVGEVVEVQIGFDGIVLANRRGAPRFDLTRRQVFLALAKEVPGADGQLQPNPHRRWNDVDPRLPAQAIEVYGPPPTSGTRDAFAELVLEEGCTTFDWVAALRESDESRFKGICHAVREDGRYVESGENDNLIVNKLRGNADALGVFGYSFLEENADQVQGSTIEGVEPTFEAISSGAYPVSRPLFFYVKKAHVGVIPGIAEYVAEFTRPEAIGPEGYLGEMGLIPLPAEALERTRRAATALAPGAATE